MAEKQANTNSTTAGQPMAALAEHFTAALLAAREKHPDFEKLEPIMETVGAALKPNFDDGKITVAQFLECLYVIARHANFVEPYRNMALGLVRPVEGVM